MAHDGVALRGRSLTKRGACRKPSHSINFVVAHDGFTLRDLVSYNDKHNDANGEGGRDGTNDNLSWNCGVEGDTGDEGINTLRWRQMRNFQVALLLSQGTPMIVAGAPPAPRFVSTKRSLQRRDLIRHKAR